jgi:hypothetical protein
VAESLLLSEIINKIVILFLLKTDFVPDCIHFRFSKCGLIGLNISTYIKCQLRNVRFKLLLPKMNHLHESHCGLEAD